MIDNPLLDLAVRMATEPWDYARVAHDLSSMPGTASNWSNFQAAIQVLSSLEQPTTVALWIDCLIESLLANLSNCELVGVIHLMLTEAWLQRGLAGDLVGYDAACRHCAQAGPLVLPTDPNYSAWVEMRALLAEICQ